MFIAQHGHRCFDESVRVVFYLFSPHFAEDYYDKLAISIYLLPLLRPA